MNEQEFHNLPKAERDRITKQVWKHMEEKAEWRLEQRYCSNCDAMLADGNKTDFCGQCLSIIDRVVESDRYFTRG